MIASPLRHGRGTWTPTITAGTGSITTSTSSNQHYEVHGRICHFRVTIGITTNGTGATSVNFTLPIQAAQTMVAIGRETALTGKAITATCAGGSSTAAAFYYDLTYPGGNGANLEISGAYFV